MHEHELASKNRDELETCEQASGYYGGKVEYDAHLVEPWPSVVEALSGHGAGCSFSVGVAEHAPEVEVLEPREGESEKRTDEDEEEDEVVRLGETDLFVDFTGLRCESVPW